MNGTVQHMTIPMGHVWLAGDNYNNSNDSRMYGPMPIGKLLLSYLLYIFSYNKHLLYIYTCIIIYYK